MTIETDNSTQRQWESGTSPLCGTREYGMSEKAEATPGPWYWFTDVNTRAQDREVWSIRFLAGSDGQGFAHTVGLNPARDAANADMIAAARDMYEALKAVQKIIGQDGASMSEQTAVLRQMREALAKARGESHD